MTGRVVASPCRKRQWGKYKKDQQQIDCKDLNKVYLVKRFSCELMFKTACSKMFHWRNGIIYICLNNNNHFLQQLDPHGLYPFGQEHEFGPHFKIVLLPWVIVILIRHLHGTTSVGSVVVVNSGAGVGIVSGGGVGRSSLCGEGDAGVATHDGAQVGMQAAAHDGTTE